VSPGKNSLQSERGRYRNVARSVLLSLGVHYRPDLLLFVTIGNCNQVAQVTLYSDAVGDRDVHMPEPAQPPRGKSARHGTTTSRSSPASPRIPPISPPSPPVSVAASLATFHAADFLANSGIGRKIVHFKARQSFFSQGDPANSVFYIQEGRAILTVVSRSGKEATIALLCAGDFVGEESIAAVPGLRLATASALTACTVLDIERQEMIRVMSEEHSMSELFLAFLLARSTRIQADLIDQLFNSSEKRLARVLLLLAELGKSGEPELIPDITQETLAEMIGTTRSRVSFFMNRFRQLGFIEYNGRIRVHKSLLNVVLHD